MAERRAYTREASLVQALNASGGRLSGIVPTRVTAGGSRETLWRVGWQQVDSQAVTRHLQYSLLLKADGTETRTGGWNAFVGGVWY